MDIAYPGIVIRGRNLFFLGRNGMSTLIPVVISVATALAGTAAFTARSAGLSREQVQGSAGGEAVDSFLADSRRYLGL